MRNFIDFITANAGRDDPIGTYCADTMRVLKLYPNTNRRLKRKKDFAALFNLGGVWQGDWEEAPEAFEAAWREWCTGQK